MGSTISLQKTPEQLAANSKKAANNAARRTMTPANVVAAHNLSGLKKLQWGGKTRKHKRGGGVFGNLVKRATGRATSGNVNAALTAQAAQNRFNKGTREQRLYEQQRANLLGNAPKRHNKAEANRREAQKRRNEYLRGLSHCQREGELNGIIMNENHPALKILEENGIVGKQGLSCFLLSLSSDGKQYGDYMFKANNQGRWGIILTANDEPIFKLSAD
jgi:hypothetical protein